MCDACVPTEQVVEPVVSANSRHGMARNATVLVEPPERGDVLPRLAQSGFHGSASVEQSASIASANLLARREGDVLTWVAVKLGTASADDGAGWSQLARPGLRQAVSSTLHDGHPRARVATTRLS